MTATGSVRSLEGVRQQTKKLNEPLFPCSVPDGPRIFISLNGKRKRKRERERERKENPVSVADKRNETGG